jgi:chromosomal replication initiator protein
LPLEVWNGVLRRLAAELPARAFEAWLRPLVVTGGPGLELRCPSPFHRDRVRDRYLSRISEAAAAEVGRPVAVKLALSAGPRSAAHPAAPLHSGSQPGLRSSGAQRELVPSGSASLAGAAPVSPTPAQQTAFAWTFDTFVTGPCNALAREASVALARGSRGISPLYLAGGPGLGKTHLARALVHEARRNGVQRPIYASAEAFTSEFTACIRSNRSISFKRRFREQCDMLVIEDVQFLHGKNLTQLELFHTLEHLMVASIPVVLTGDRLPREIPTLEPRLCSRMASGLVAELEPPDAQVRRLILRERAARGGVRLPEECLDRLVDAVRGSVRDLESALIQVVTTGALLKRPLDLELTEAALRKVAAPEAPTAGLEPREVVEVVAGFFGLRPEQLASRSRRRDVLLPRQLSMYLCRRYTTASLQAIGEALGKNHPAVSNAIEQMERRVLESPPLRYQVEELSSRLDARLRARA